MSNRYAFCTSAAPMTSSMTFVERLVCEPIERVYKLSSVHPSEKEVTVPVTTLLERFYSLSGHRGMEYGTIKSIPTLRHNIVNEKLVFEGYVSESPHGSLSSLVIPFSTSDQQIQGNISFIGGEWGTYDSGQKDKLSALVLCLTFHNFTEKEEYGRLKKQFPRRWL
jgi:hypothetical protein